MCLVIHLQQHDIIVQIRWVIHRMDVVKLHLNAIPSWLALFQIKSPHYNGQIHPSVGKKQDDSILFASFLTLL